MHTTATADMVNIYAGMIDTKKTITAKADIFEGFSTDFGGEGSAIEIANNIRYSHPGSKHFERMPGITIEDWMQQ